MKPLRYIFFFFSIRNRRVFHFRTPPVWLSASVPDRADVHAGKYSDDPYLQTAAPEFTQTAPEQETIDDLHVGNEMRSKYGSQNLKNVNGK